MEAFSDGVIAIIITIMVLELKVPQDNTWAAFLKQTPTYFSYTLSFLLVAVYWVNHHHAMHLVQRVNGFILWANINLLFWMSLMPWATASLGSSHAFDGRHEPSLMVQLYVFLALAVAIAFLILGYCIQQQHRSNPSLMSLHAKLRHKNYIAIAIYVVALCMTFFSTAAAMVLVILPALMYFLPDSSVEHHLKD